MTSSAAEPRLRWYDWAALDRDRLYRLLKLRSEIFVVEQDCVFLDIDGLDQQAEHLCAEAGDGELHACLRVLPPAGERTEAAIGRVVVRRDRRGAGLGHRLTAEAISRCEVRFPGTAQRVSAQEHLQAFYGRHGFVTISERYLDDGIWHVDMRRAR